ncbi:MAG: radical SAM protein [Bacteroidales bacterium]|nr:radical SAM protein [Bacteroidales bacterium]
MKYFYLPFWFFKTRILGMKIPLVSVVFITNLCNLRCKHCCIYTQKNPITKNYEQVDEDLRYCYKQGARFVDFEGGEPTLWQDGDKNLNDLIALAKKIGFFSTTVTTNAQKDFSDCKADSIWVSMDGYGGYHDEVRGEGSFDKLVYHIEKANHPNLSVNMVVNKLNYTSVDEVMEFVKTNPKISKISINFHTPYEGTEQLVLDWEKRNKVIDKVISYKRKDYAIMNSVSGLKRMKDMNFKKYCWISNFVHFNGVKTSDCGGTTIGLCPQCGFCMAGEMNAVMSLKFDTLTAGLKLRL